MLEGGQRGTIPHRISGANAGLTHLEKKIHNMINAERKKQGLPALLWDEDLHSIARKHSQDMERRNFFSHDDPEGRNFSDRYKDALFECRIRTGEAICRGGENISMMYLDNPSFVGYGKTFLDSDTEDRIAESVVKRWIASKNHRANILTPYFRRQGIGVAISGEGKVYVTEDFC
jgi:uncharacterized protein YkwD